MREFDVNVLNDILWIHSHKKKCHHHLFRVKKYERDPLIHFAVKNIVLNILHAYILILMSNFRWYNILIDHLTFRFDGESSDVYFFSWRSIMEFILLLFTNRWYEVK